MFHLNQLVANQLTEQFRIKKTLGSGGFGTVFLAEDVNVPQRQVVLKVPHQQTMGLRVLRDESEILAKLDHPGILRFHGVGMQDGIVFLVMEYVAGESLADRIDRDGVLKPAAFHDIMGQVLAAIEHAHERNVVHRDLRPSNILIADDGRVKVADFGVSKILATNRHAVTRIGSPPYMAPEQFAGRTVLASDIYALGVIMYEMVTATLPIPEVQAERVWERLRRGGVTPPRVRNPATSEHLNGVILKAMAPDLKNRYARVAELREALQARPVRSVGEGIREIRQRLQAQPRARTRSLCWNCHKPLAKRATVCVHCGEGQ